MPLRQPGWYRAGLFTGIALALSYALSFGARAGLGYDPVLSGESVTRIALLIMPFGFLFGLGTFDFWFAWAAGKPTKEDDHSGHGATSWKSYFLPNTDHKVIGIQYTVLSFFWLFVGGLMAMLVRAELAAPGRQFVDSNAYNGIFSVHATLLIFLFIIPVFAGLANYVIPLMIGAPDMAFPRLNALSFWLLPIAGVMMMASFFAPGGSFASGWTAYAPLSTTSPIGQDFFTIGVQFAGASSIATGAELPGDHHHHAGARDVVLPDAAARVGELLHVAARGHRHPVHRGVAVLRPARPRARLQLLRRGPGRRRADVPARLLVLLAPGRLHHDAAGLRDRLGDPRGEGPQADLRLPDDGLLAAGHRGARLHRVGPPHVRLGHAGLDPRADDGHHGDHRRADRASRSSRGWRRCGAACCSSTRRCSSPSAS
jgi:hypothetical protein